VHPTLFKIGSFPISTYGLCVAVGLYLGVMLAERRAKKFGFDSDRILDLAFIGIISAFAGAKALYILVNFSDFLEEPLSYIFNRGGFVFLGGLLTGSIAGAIYLRWKKLPFLEIGDIVVPSIALGHAFGRIGCFMAGCCFGRVSSVFGIRFPAGSVCYDAHVFSGQISPMSAWSLPVIPTQLISSGANLAIFFYLIWALKRRRFSGEIFYLYLILYSISRFLQEFLRGDIERGVFWGGFSTAQIMVAILFAVAVFFRYRQSKIRNQDI